MQQWISFPMSPFLEKGWDCVAWRDFSSHDFQKSLSQRGSACVSSSSGEEQAGSRSKEPKSGNPSLEFQLKVVPGNTRFPGTLFPSPDGAAPGLV